jgi:hypothetical protein
MRVFISWSGTRSKAVAAALREYLKKVIQSVDPWMSDKDIDSGVRWSDAIAGNLREARVGIACITPENRERPWLNFESGAISKTVEDAYLCPYLFRLELAELTGPLAQFQARKSDREDTFRLVETINSHDDLKASLSEQELRDSFEMWWPKLEEKLAAIPECREDRTEPRPPKNMEAETLTLTRQIAKDVARLTSVLSVPAPGGNVTKITEMTALRALLSSHVTRLPLLAPSNVINAVRQKSSKQLMGLFPTDDTFEIIVSYAVSGLASDGAKAYSALTGATPLAAKGTLEYLTITAKKAGIEIPTLH